ncbi:sel1 repeat family protein [Pseudomonas fakonensis]|uniref:Sel1 repeat family protein n=1 Tax=Pseudomonas fakonensis TaxID=2842355 RepID=A0ABX8MY48_9PSED|nr:tetratricopeptide repeat protein [Pseudomonas fakonensis]QXH49194.1 sel1 repeat family protein [Pseudomonas fakonensis]
MRSPHIQNAHPIASFLAAALTTLLLPVAWSDEQGTAIVANAKILYNQRVPAIPQLRAAAELGDPESQFYLAESLSQPLFTMSKEAYAWYEKSANQGDLYAMYRLAYQDNEICKIMQNCIAPERAPSDWKKQLISSAKEKARLGDGEAMSILYFITNDLMWLEKAAEAGDSNAQWLLANRYSEGRGFFIIPSNRKKAEERLLKLAAENGSPKAQIAYAGLLAERGDNEVGAKWYLAAVNQSYITALSSYAYMFELGGFYDFPKNPIKAYSFHLIVSSLETKDQLHVETEARLKSLKKYLSPQDLETAKSFADDWIKSHPPLSLYRMKLGM